MGRLNRTMVDLETLDTSNSSVILSIGVVEFDFATRRIEPLMAEHLPIQPQMDEGRTKSEATELWWKQQSPEAQRRIHAGRDYWDQFSVQTQRDVLEGVRRRLEHVFTEADEIWANDPDFDCAILKHFMQGRPSFRWPFWKHASVRTIKRNFHALIPDSIQRGLEHDAMDDAVYQAKQIMSVLSGLRIDYGVPVADTRV